MRIPGKIVQVSSIPSFEDMPPGVIALTGDGRVFVTYDDKPPEEWTWTETNLTVEES